MSKITGGLLGCMLIICGTLSAQADHFPQSWIGNWKGELSWYKQGIKKPQKINMELYIHPADSANTFTWQIIYGSEKKDNRPYTLLPKDTATGHWLIDEKDGIVLDQFMLGGQLCGAFTVQSSTIFNCYQMDNRLLIVEFYTIVAKPIATTGKGTEETPFVDSYKVGSYQKAVLRRTK